MPHIQLEHSSNINETPDTKILLEKLHALLLEISPFQEKDLRSRIFSRNHFLVSNGQREQAFIHLQLAILPGRTAELKRTLSDRLLAFLQSEFSETAQKRYCSFTVEIREMDNNCYSKVLTAPVTPSE